MTWREEQQEEVEGVERLAAFARDRGFIVKMDKSCGVLRGASIFDPATEASVASFRVTHVNTRPRRLWVDIVDDGYYTEHNARLRLHAILQIYTSKALRKIDDLVAELEESTKVLVS